MPITILDLVLLAVMLISGLLAMVRGFMREILSIAAWGTAALVTLYAFGKLLPTAKTYFNNDTVASLVVVAAAALLVGFGTRLGNGCTSGHGVCGIARSRRSVCDDEPRSTRR